MAESHTRGLGCALVTALFAFSAVVTAVAMLGYRLWQAESRPIGETAGIQLKQETAAGSEGQRQTAPAPRLTPRPRHAPGRAPDNASSSRVLKGHGAIVAVVAVSADGAQLLSADINDSICTWDRIAGTRLTTIESTGLGLRRAVFSPNSRYILACDNENGVRMWKASSGQAVRTFRRHTDLVSALHFVPGTDQFLSSSFDATLILWDMQTEKPIRQFGKVLNAKDGAQPTPSAPEELNRHSTGHSTWIRAVVALPDGKRVVSAGNDGVVFLWDLETGTLVYRFEGHQGAIIGLTLAPDGRWVASLGADKEIIVWDVEQRKLLRRSKHPSNEFPAMEISPDSRLLALGDDAGVIRLMDLESGAERSQIETGGIGVASLAFTPELEGAEIVAGCTDGTIRIWPLPLER